MEDVRKIDNDKLSEVAGGDIEDECSCNYVCPECGEELVLMRRYGFTKLYYKCHNCSEDFSLEEIENNPDLKKKY